jgi:CheY-like chemotaxis protein
VRTTNSALIVEDHPAMRRFLAAQLEQMGWEVTEAANASEAIEVLKANRPSVITLDLIMNPVGGITSMAVVRAAALQPQNPTVFILTSKASYTDRQAALAAGAKQVFLKPVLAANGFEALFSEIEKLRRSSDSVAAEDGATAYAPCNKSD